MIPFNDLNKSEIGNDFLSIKSSLNMSHSLNFGCQLSFACSNKYSILYIKETEKLQFCIINQFPRSIADCKAKYIIYLTHIIKIYKLPYYKH